MSTTRACLSKRGTPPGENIGKRTRGYAKRAVQPFAPGNTYKPALTGTTPERDNGGEDIMKSKTKKPELIVVVVASEIPQAETGFSVPVFRSRRPGKIQCWSSFIGYDREAVLTEATKAVQDWHREGAGPYNLYLGTLTTAMVPKTQFRTVKL